MKRKVLLTIIPALMVLSSCAGANLKAKDNLFLEDTLAHDEIFASGSGLGIRKLAPIDGSGPSIGFQTAEDGDNISIRFVAAVKITGELTDATAVWTRTMYEDDGDVFKVAAEKSSTKAYTSITENSEELTIAAYNAARGGTDYTHFVVYTMRNIPKSTYGNYFLNASLSINGDAAAKVVATSINQNKQLSFAPSQEGYFLNGTIGGVANSSLASVAPSGDDVARFSSSLAANDKFFICYNHVDATPANSKFKVYDSSVLSDNPFFVDDESSAKMIKTISAHNYAFNFTDSYELSDIESGYTVTYTDNSDAVITAPLFFDGYDGSSKPQHCAFIAPKTGSSLVFNLDGNPVTPSREDNENNNINNDRVVLCGGDNLDIYLKDLGGGSRSLWVNYPNLKVLVNGNPVPAAPRANPRGNAAVYDVPLHAGDKVIINRGYNQLHLGDTENVEFTASNNATYAFYVNGEYKVYTDELTTVTFNVNYDTHNNGSLYAVGNFSGDWEPWIEYKLTWSDGNNWVGSLLLPVGKQLQLCVAPTENPSKGAVIAWQGSNKEIVRGMSVTSW